MAGAYCRIASLRVRNISSGKIGLRCVANHLQHVFAFVFWGFDGGSNPAQQVFVVDSKLIQGYAFPCFRQHRNRVRTGGGSSCDKMSSDATWEVITVVIEIDAADEIEIDIAEEIEVGTAEAPPDCKRTVKDEQGQLGTDISFFTWMVVIKSVS